MPEPLFETVWTEMLWVPSPIPSADLVNLTNISPAACTRLLRWPVAPGTRPSILLHRPPSTFPAFDDAEQTIDLLWLLVKREFV